MANESVFNSEIMQSIETFSEAFKCKFAIGVDTYDEKALTYCLCKRIGDVSEVLLLKKMNDREIFEEEVSNLQKYFDAVVVRDEG